MSKKSFVFYASWMDAINELPQDMQLESLRAIIEYGLSGEVAENLSFTAKAILAIAKVQMDVNNVRFENGKKGGRPKNQTKPNETKQNQTKPNETEMEISKPNVNVNVNDNVNIKNHDINIMSKKEAEKHHYAPCVMLTESEYGKLVEAHGEDGAAWMVKKLDDYKAASGRTYKSDYRAILNWVVDEYRKHVAEQITGAYGDSGSVESNQDRERRKRNEEFKRHIERKLRGLEQ